VKKKLFLLAGFITAVWLPLLQMNLHFYPEFDNRENRKLVDPPDFDLPLIRQWPARCNAFLCDRFGMRPDLIRWNSVLRVRLLGVSPVRSVIMGKDGWLFYRSEAQEDGNTIDDHRGKIPLTARDLADLRSTLEENEREFSKRGIAYLVVIAPNKNTAYPDYLPEGIGSPGTVTRLDQFMNYMKAHSGVRVIDLREALLRARKKYPTYLKTDSHWNTYGAYVGFQEIVRALCGRFPTLAPALLESVHPTLERSLPGGDLSQMLFMQDLTPEDNRTRFIPAGLPDSPVLDTIVFRHDSFGDNLYPFLTPLARRIVNITPFAPFDFEALERNHPQVVLHVFVERYLPQAVHGEFYHKQEISASDERT
jgi:alginate O-acetyltransferase complex protein AlgJ